MLQMSQENLTMTVLGLLFSITWDCSGPSVLPDVELTVFPTSATSCFLSVCSTTGSESPSDSFASSELKSLPPDLLDLLQDEELACSELSSFFSWGSSGVCSSFLEQALSEKNGQISTVYQI